MPVITVQGIINSDRLGITSSHEHVLIELRHQFLELEIPAVVIAKSNNVSTTYIHRWLRKNGIKKGQ